MSDQPIHLTVYVDNQQAEPEDILTFGIVTVGDTKTLPLMIRNDDLAPIEHLHMELPPDFTVEAFPTSLLVGESQQFFLHYHPTQLQRLLADNEPTMTKTDDGQLQIHFMKELKGAMIITGHIVRTREVVK